MKIKEPVNRVAVEQKMWDDREARFIETFKAYPNATKSRAFNIEKLEYYDEVQKKFRNSPDKDERMAARFLKEEANKLEKKLYPSQTVRFLRAILNTFSSKHPPKLEVQPENQVIEKQMSAGLRADLIKTGFGSVIKEVERQIKEGNTEIKVPAELFFGPGQRAHYTVGIKQDVAGNHQLLGFQASIPNQDMPGDVLTQKYYFEDDSAITAKKAFNQLSGRAIAVEYGKGAEKQVNMVALDFNDKDAAGNFKKIEVPMDHFDWTKEIAKLPLKDMGQPLITRLERSIMDGNREQITFSKAGNEHTFYMESNPQNKSVLISDDQQNKLSLNEAISITQNRESFTQSYSPVQSREEKLGMVYNAAYLKDQFNKMPLLNDTKIQLDKTIANLLAGKSGKVMLTVENKPHAFSLFLDKKEGLIIRDQAKNIVTQKDMWTRWTPEPMIKTGLETAKQVEMTFTKAKEKEALKHKNTETKTRKVEKKRSRGIA